MAANGALPTRRGASGRKQWVLHDNSKTAINGLRLQLATDGCPISQVVLAKQLLEDEGDLHEQRENARQGVYWLMKASEQGNTEATELLKECLNSGKGISEHNYLDVKSCMSMTQNEKLARKAAKEMFASLSNGGDYITSDQLQRKMLEINRGDPSTSHGDWVLLGNDSEDISDEDTDWSQRSDNNEKLTEDHLVQAAVHYSHGRLPDVNNVLCLTQPNLQTLDNIPYVQRSILHPFLVVKILYFKIIRFLANSSAKIGSFYSSDFKLVYLLVLYALLNSGNIFYVIPMIVYYVTIAVMVFSTFQMLQTKREFYDFRIWSGLFLTYSGGSLNAEQAEFEYIRNNLKPFGYFFGSLLTNFLIYPVIIERYMPESEITVLAFCLTFMTLIGFMYRKREKTLWNYWVLLSFSINVLAKYPYDNDSVVTQGWRYLDLNTPTFVSYIIGNGVEFCINFRTLLYICIPLILLQIARMENWRGIYKFLIPHCVTLSWFQIVVISSQGATMYGLIRSTLALVGVVMFLPLAGLTSIVLPAAALSNWLINSDIVATIALFLLLFILGFTSIFLLAKSRFRNFTAFVQTCIALITIYYALNAMPYDDSYTIWAPKSINYEQYQKFCHEHAWRQENIATTQIRCSKLQGLPVSWDGYVNSVKVKSTKNSYKYLLDKLPDALRNTLYCFFGSKVQDSCEENSEDCFMFFDIVKSNGECHLDMYDVHELEILVKMNADIWGKGGEIVLETDSYPALTNFSLKLRKDDQIWFKGSLENPGSKAVSVKLQSLGCMTCQDATLKSVYVKMGWFCCFESEELFVYLKCSLRNILNFIFSPLIVFK